jgi:SAM-dependent methyltransferase
MEQRAEKQGLGDLRTDDGPQGYGEKFARIYNLRWTGFAASVAPQIHALYKSLPIASSNERLLDVACGTGQLIAWFLERGFTCTGLDASPHMLSHARRNAGRFAEQGKADFIQLDASRFDLPRGYGLAVSTFDALNHLPDRRSLADCLSSVFRVLVPGGRFVFDLNTRKGLGMWNSLTVEETDELFILNRGIYDPGMGRAYDKITGFMRTDGDRYEKFEQTAYNTAFDMRETGEDLAAAGFRWYCASQKDLSAAVDEPEDLTRAFFVADKLL